MNKYLFITFSFLSLSFLLPAAAAAQSINAKERARKHAIQFNKPPVDIFEGALLGKGGMGVVNTRPDAIGFRFAHNNVWDIGVAEKNKDKMGTFQKVLGQAKAIEKKNKKIFTILHLEIW
jgi:hypothetical protein